MYVGDVASRYKSLDLSHGRTRYLEAGQGPAVILLHGVSFALGADAWLANISELASGLRVLAPDFPGWGPGGQLELGYSFGYPADFIREFQDALGLENSHIVGHSMGGPAPYAPCRAADLRRGRPQHPHRAPG